MDKEALEKEIDKLLKEQKEIRVLVAENRDAYLIHLAYNLNDLAQVYINLAKNILVSNKLANIDELYFKAEKLLEEQKIMRAELEAAFINAHPLNTPL